jgi:hypothetical protein
MFTHRAVQVLKTLMCYIHIHTYAYQKGITQTCITREGSVCPGPPYETCRARSANSWEYRGSLCMPFSSIAPIALCRAWYVSCGADWGTISTYSNTTRHINNCHQVTNTVIHSNTMNPTQYHTNTLLRLYLFITMHKFVPDEDSLKGRNTQME